jgi:predicted TIM-barrel enzyme
MANKPINESGINYKDSLGKYKPQYPDDFNANRNRALTHEEMNYNLDLIGQVIKGYRVIGTGINGELDLDNIDYVLKLYIVSESDTSLIEAGAIVGEHVWLTAIDNDTQLTTEEVQDIMGNNTWIDGDNTTVVYNDANGTLKINAPDDQALSISGHTISLTNGGSVTVPDNDTQLSTGEVQDIMGNNTWINGNNTTVIYDDVAGNLKINAPDDQVISIIDHTISLTNGGSVTVPDNNTQLTTEEVQDIMGNNTWINGNNTTVIYDDVAGTLKINATGDQALSISGHTISLTNGGSVTVPDDQVISIIDHTISLTNGGSVTVPDNNTQLSTEEVQDIMGNNTWIDGNNTTVIYDDVAGTLKIDATGDQALSIIGHTISLTNGGSVTVPDNNTQLSTEEVLNTPLTGFTVASANITLSATSTILKAFEALEYRVSNKQDNGNFVTLDTAQTIAEQKEFTLDILTASNKGIDVVSSVGSDVLNIGTINANVINIGSPTATINILGTLQSNNVTNLEIADKLVLYNKGGGVDTGGNSGFSIEENDIVTGYFKTVGTRDGWKFKAPANSYNAILYQTDLTGNRTYNLPDASGTLLLKSQAINQQLTGFTVATSNVNLSETNDILSAFESLEYRVNINDAKVTNSNQDLSDYVDKFSIQLDIEGDKTFNDNVKFTKDVVLSGLRIGRGNGDSLTNTVFGFNVFSNNTTGSNNVANGYNSLSLNTTGSGNTTSGSYALYSNITGNNNTAIGYQSLYNNTTGSFSIANGYQSLYNNTTGSRNIASGYQSLFYNNTGSNNISNGYQSLYSNTTGSNNIANGNSTLASNTTGGDNIANGYQSMYYNATGNYNTANGHKSLFRNTTGSFNVASGYFALSSNTTGSDNIASGSQSLYSNTTGNYNVANGGQSLYNNTTGTYNIANGNSALYRNTTGSNNIASGYYALRNNVTGSNNTANGSSSLYSNTFGINNIANGFQSLYSNTTGNNNVANGYQSGRLTLDNSENEISNNSVFIGANTKAKSNNETNQIVIGHEAIGNGSNTVTIGNSNITDNYFNGKVRATSFIGDGSQLTNLAKSGTSNERIAATSTPVGVSFWDTDLKIPCYLESTIWYNAAGGIVE